MHSEIHGTFLSIKTVTFIRSFQSPSYTQNQTVNDGVAHSKNSRKCAYHVTFDLDFDLEHTLDAG